MGDDNSNAPQLPDTAALPGQPQRSLLLPGLRLTVVEGPDAGVSVSARRGIIRIGTADDNDLVLKDPAVSRRHCEVCLKTDGVIVRDLSSTNGTSIDGVRVFEAQLSPSSLIRLGTTAIRAVSLQEPVTVPLSTNERFGRLLGRSTAMRSAFAILERVSPTETTVLIEGETGTGKELAAEAIHAYSTRTEGPFITVDCGAIAPTLIESELFGHMKGAFTGAVSDRRGAFEDAHEGTVFLDEIGELPLELQPKLLRVLESREIRRVGSTRPIKIDVRVIAATNRDLATEVNRGAFREDLYFRLAVVRVLLPPLRARLDDIPLLARVFLETFAPGAPAPSERTLSALMTRPWPGNVRELRNAMEQAVALAGTLPEAVSGVVAPRTEQRMDQLLPQLLKMPMKEATERLLGTFERSYLEHVLRISDSVTGAARAAGIHRRYMQRLMRKHGMTNEVVGTDVDGGEEPDR